jgi:chromosome segregation ATPase
VPKLHVNKVRTVCGASVGDKPITVGRSSQNDIVLPHRAVSRQHCVIESDGNGGLRLRDLGSHYGTKVNGEAATEVDLRDGDVIGVGPYEITIDEAAMSASTGHEGLELAPAEDAPTVALERAPAHNPAAAAMEEALAAERETLERLRADLAEQQAAIDAREALIPTPPIGDLIDADDEAPAPPPSDAQVAALEDRLADTLARAAEAEERLEKERERRKALEATIDEQTTAVDEERIAALEAERDEAVAGLRADLEGARGELEAARSSAASELAAFEARAAEAREAAQAAAAEALDAEQAKVVAAEAERDAQRERAEAAEGASARLETERDEATRAADAARESLQRELEERNKEIRSGRDELRQTERHLDDARRKLEKTLAEADDLGARLGSVEARLLQSQRDVAETDQALERIMQLRRELLESSHEVSASQHNVDALEAMWLETDEQLAEADGTMDPVLAMRRETIAHRLEEAHEDREQAIVALQEIIGRLCEIETPVREGLTVRRRGRFTIGGLLRKD